MSRGSRKPGLKNAIEPYDAVENNEKIILILSFEHDFINNWDIIYLNVYFSFFEYVITLCYHGNPSEEAQLTAVHVLKSKEEKTNSP